MTDTRTASFARRARPPPSPRGRSAWARPGSTCWSCRPARRGGNRRWRIRAISPAIGGFGTESLAIFSPGHGATAYVFNRAGYWKHAQDWIADVRDGRNRWADNVRERLGEIGFSDGPHRHLRARRLDALARRHRAAPHGRRAIAASFPQRRDRRCDGAHERESAPSRATRRSRSSNAPPRSPRRWRRASWR